MKLPQILILSVTEQNKYTLGPNWEKTKPTLRSNYSKPKSNGPLTNANHVFIYLFIYEVDPPMTKPKYPKSKIITSKLDLAQKFHYILTN